MKTRTILTMSMMLLTAIGIAQEKSFTNLKNVNPNSIGTIGTGEDISGYFMLYLIDKVDRKTNLYSLEILDNNLKTTHQVSLKRPAGTGMIDGLFNGNAFCFVFNNPKESEMEHLIISKDGKEVGKHIAGKDRTHKLTVYSTTEHEEGLLYTGGMSAAGNKGFVRIAAGEKGDHRQFIEMFDNEGKVQWTTGTGDKDKGAWEFMQIHYTSNDYIVVYYSTRDKAMSLKDTKNYILIIDTNDGSVLGKTEINSEDKFLSPFGITFNPENKSFYLYGEYYGMKGQGKPDFKNKIGFFLLETGADGSISSEKFVTWKGDISKLLPLDDKGDMADGYSVFIHNLVFSTNGKIYAIGEQFKKTATAGSLLAAGLGSNTAAAVIQLKNMMVFEFSNELELTEVYNIDKPKTNVFLPQGFSTVGEDKLAMLIALYGWFDYDYTTVNADASSFTSVFTGYDRTAKRGESRYVIAYAGLDVDGKLVDGRVNMSNEPTWFAAIPSKSGYIAVFEYHRKEKTATLRLEKLDL